MIQSTSSRLDRKIPSPQQAPSQKLKQMEWDFGQKFREEIPKAEEEITTKTRKWWTFPARRRKLLPWGWGRQSSSRKEQKMAMECLQNLSVSQSLQLAGKVSSHVDQNEQLDSLSSPPRGRSISNHKLIKTYKKSSNATKKIKKYKIK